MRRLLFIAAIVASLFSNNARAWDVPDETLHYSVRFKWGLIDANAGIATVTTVNNPAANRFTATVTGKSVNLLGHYYVAGDTITGTMMSDSFKPVYTQHLISEEGEFSIETITYEGSDNKSAGNVVKKLPNGKELRSRVSHYAGGLTLDLLSVFYYVRQIDYGSMKPGEQVVVNIFSGKSPETLTVTYNGTGNYTGENVSGEVYNVEMKFTAEGGGPGNCDVMHMEISTDARRIPYYIVGSLKIGHLICRYVG